MSLAGCQGWEPSRFEGTLVAHVLNDELGRRAAEVVPTATIDALI
jgi:hypothetical protein